MGKMTDSKTASLFELVLLLSVTLSPVLAQTEQCTLATSTSLECAILNLQARVEALESSQTGQPLIPSVIEPAYDCDYRFGTSCYKVFEDTERTRQQAADHCASLGSHLVDIETEAEYEYIRDNIQRVKEFHWTDAVYEDGEWKWATKNVVIGDINHWRYGTVRPPSDRYNTPKRDRFMSLQYTRVWFRSYEQWKRSSICESDVPTAAPAPRSPCPPNFPHRLFGSCYMFNNLMMTWDEAKLHCTEQLGGHLADVTSDNEKEFMDYIRGRTSTATWIGGVYTESSKRWSWSHNDVTITLEGWRTVLGVGFSSVTLPLPTADRCLVMITWHQDHDYECTRRLASICEKPFVTGA